MNCPVCNKKMHTHIRVLHLVEKDGTYTMFHFRCGENILKDPKAYPNAWFAIRDFRNVEIPKEPERKHKAYLTRLRNGKASLPHVKRPYRGSKSGFAYSMSGYFG